MQTTPPSTVPPYSGAHYAEVDRTGAGYGEPTAETRSSAVSWAAILVGALAAAALSLILLALGSGLGFSSVSPWANDGASAKAMGIATVFWIILMAAIASGMGGYLAGRLRIRWEGVHPDEVYFRDTAHGFMTWAIATLLTAALLSSAVGSLLGGAAKLGGAAAGAAVAGGATALGEMADSSSSDGYFVDMLFRRGPQTTTAEAPIAATAPLTPSPDVNNVDPGAALADSTTGSGSTSGEAAMPEPTTPRPLRRDRPSTDIDDASARAEVSRILVVALREGELAPADQTYLAQLVAQHADVSQVEAEQRVTRVIEDAKAAAAELEQGARQAADEARKAGAKLSLWLFVSLLVGAFCGSYAATIGGRQRDRDGVMLATRTSRPLPP